MHSRQTKIIEFKHLPAGREMQAAYLQVQGLGIKFANAYGRRSKISKQFKKLHRQFLITKSIADDLFFENFPDAQHSPYFGDYFSD